MSHQWSARLAMLALILALSGRTVQAQAPATPWDPSKPTPGFQLGPTDDKVTPGQFFVDPPTIHNLGFRWYIEGDSNRNAAVNVAYRRKGDADWRNAQPMLRVQNEVVNRDFEPWRCGNLFAGSVMLLEPATTYEIRFTMTDADGGAPPEKIVEATTLAEPVRYQGDRRVTVLPADHEGPRPEGAVADLAEALKQARPGDVLLLHAGVHRGNFLFRKSGQPDRPIVLRGAGDGEAIIEGLDHKGVLFDVRDVDHIHIEDLTFRVGRCAVHGGTKGGPGTAGLVVRRCRIEDVESGIWTTSENAENWFVADNVLVGMNPTWFPRTTPTRSYMEPSHTGINVYGRGHVIAHNSVTRFSDSLAIANFGPPADDLQKHCVNVDFHHNDLSWAQDDTIEADYGCHNIRVYRNRCCNAHTGLSVQPSYGGPIYLIRNEVFGISHIAYKLHNYCTGIVALHNTTCTAGNGFGSFNRWQNGIFRNNLVLGSSGAAIETGSITPYTTLDYNGYRRNDPDRFIRWFDGQRKHSPTNLAEFANSTGHERHGIELDYDVFVRATKLEQGTTVEPADWDLRLAPASRAIDAGVRLPNVNDDFTGQQPDLGAHQRDTPLPHYGPREKYNQTSAKEWKPKVQCRIEHE
jgi:hypothetical protein